MSIRIPEIHPISDLARDARALIERVRRRQEPIVITQRGRDVAVLLPVELYREMERGYVRKIPSVRFVDPSQAEHFHLEMTVLGEGEGEGHA